MGCCFCNTLVVQQTSPMFRLLIVFLFSASLVYAQPSAPDKANHIGSTGSKIKSTDAELILRHHNAIRTDIGVSTLTWSTSLAAYAQQWANYLAANNNCDIKHRDVSGENGKLYGENIFWGSSAAAFPPVQASYDWYGEKRLYKYRKISAANYFKTGHYTQMIWKDTREMGVGVAVCPNGSVIVVANYYPAGNVIGQYPY
jgi:pathogenesis-related protein 1